MSILDEGKTPEQLNADRNEQRERDHHDAVTAMWAHFHMHSGSRIDVATPARRHHFKVLTVHL